MFDLWCFFQNSNIHFDVIALIAKYLNIGNYSYLLNLNILLGLALMYNIQVSEKKLIKILENFGSLTQALA